MGYQFAKIKREKARSSRIPPYLRFNVGQAQTMLRQNVERLFQLARRLAHLPVKAARLRALLVGRRIQVGVIFLRRNRLHLCLCLLAAFHTLL